MSVGDQVRRHSRRREDRAKHKLDVVHSSGMDSSALHRGKPSRWQCVILLGRVSYLLPPAAVRDVYQERRHFEIGDCINRMEDVKERMNERVQKGLASWTKAQVSGKETLRGNIGQAAPGRVGGGSRKLSSKAGSISGGPPSALCSHVMNERSAFPFARFVVLNECRVRLTTRLRRMVGGQQVRPSMGQSAAFCGDKYSLGSRSSYTEIPITSIHPTGSRGRRASFVRAPPADALFLLLRQRRASVRFVLCERRHVEIP